MSTPTVNWGMVAVAIGFALLMAARSGVGIWIGGSSAPVYTGQPVECRYLTGWGVRTHLLLAPFLADGRKCPWILPAAR
jgi:hypothetical protein